MTVEPTPTWEAVRSLHFTEQGLERFREMLHTARLEHDNAIYAGDTDRATRLATSVFTSITALSGLGGYVTADLDARSLYCVQTQGPLHFGVNVSSHDGTWSVNS